ncbi:hypothetical protein [Marichromatium gracile]|uniref:Uncharacterized protein n=1 Tax=Marichromatium gracile TaxID=1048 RepID=A0A4R4ACB2_MARGR|nr:hypothetical protein [Marichromatium gracile]MBK1709334.1 hypothetical protein [Marichromatium gracile]MBO8085860.1 hypothetical protein [Marichromatium sp.]TCW36236.1 hypothetical protein EDC29_10419 [Marichromatium gracile]
MEHRPHIRTAIPKRRYRLDGCEATLLGEIDSADPRPYRFILAFVPAGQGEPSLYVCAERGGEGDRLRVVSALLDEVMAEGLAWDGPDAFAEQALTLGRQVLGLRGGAAQRLL